MAWISLFIAGLLEIVFAISLKYTEGFTRLIPSIITFVALVGSLLMLSSTMKTLPIGTAYAVWTGIGAVGAAIVGIIMLNEPVNAMRVISLVVIIIGILGLKLSS